MKDTQGYPEVESPRDLARRLQLPFSDHRLLSRALTHRSFLNEHPEAIEDNERLEFLGDAVLDFLVGAWLYNHFPEMNEGQLTRMRSALVRTEQLSVFASRIDLGSAVRLGYGEEAGGGRKRLALLCASFEALVGALYLDAGLQAVRDFVEPMLGTAAANILDNHKEKDPKSILQERVQSQGYGPPVYRTTAAYGPDHAKVFEVEVLVGDQVRGRGQGRSKQSAAKSAAREALLSMEGI
jgi:ribonuclease-3